jgi:hypothetical protein
MAKLLFESEQQLLNTLKTSRLYLDFVDSQLKCKIERETKAWKLLLDNKGKFTKELLANIFDIVDMDGLKTRWFGALLATPNKNLIFQSSIKHITEWVELLCFSELPVENILDKCLGTIKIKGASKGLATLLLYLSAPEKYSIWVDKTYGGLSVFGRIRDIKNANWGTRYVAFNNGARQFAQSYSIEARALDWVLSFLGRYVDSISDGKYEIDEDVLGNKDILVPVDDELDEKYGEPMELGLMRWTPTNEMGVVALFIEFRKELGFPIVDFIRPQFPDAAVFEQTKNGHVKRYIEFEYRSTGFRSHLTSNRKCHYVVCWEHDWKDCPIPAIELKVKIPEILRRRNSQS